MIHPTAFVDPSAKVAASCSIGPYCIVGADVELGENCELISHVAIHGPAKIGSGNRFFSFCAIGGEPQDVSYKGEKTRLEMGDNNVVRECVTLNRGTTKGGGV
ncbi:MAG TPA: acyl-[acyl-carrier-protein]--UDP-N-acetylglucosamine O-acyltransferase, partial [Candidatus Angelobacter sp.]|nr:acyl-[acyl-carrier-protein]--UDP-N-acetylglucosamine O-acyltransferase [Candidatus Angelobacter sp.]